MAGTFCDLDQCGAKSSARKIAQAADGDSRIHQSSDRTMNGSAIALDGCLELESFARGHNGDSVAANVSAENDGVSRTNLLRSNANAVIENADSCGVDEDS